MTSTFFQISKISRLWARFGLPPFLPVHVSTSMVWMFTGLFMLVLTTLYHWSQTPYFGAVYALNSSFPLGVDKVLKVATSAYTLPGSKEYINIYVYIDGNVVSTMAFRTRPLASHLRYDHHEALFLEFVLHCLVACGVHPDQLSLRFPGWKG